MAVIQKLSHFWDPGRKVSFLAGQNDLASACTVAFKMGPNDLFHLCEREYEFYGTYAFCSNNVCSNNQTIFPPVNCSNNFWIVRTISNNFLLHRQTRFRHISGIFRRLIDEM